MKLLTGLFILSLTFSALASGGSYDPNNSKHRQKVIKACEKGDAKKLQKWKRKGWNPLDNELFGDETLDTKNPLFGIQLFKDFSQKAYNNCIGYLVGEGANVHETFFGENARGNRREASIAAFIIEEYNEDDAIKMISALVANGLNINIELIMYGFGGDNRYNAPFLVVGRDWKLENIKKMVAIGGNIIAGGQEGVINIAHLIGRQDIVDYIKTL